MTKAAPPAAPVFRKSRRFKTGAVVMSCLESLLIVRVDIAKAAALRRSGRTRPPHSTLGGFGLGCGCAGGAMDGFADALIGAAAANVAGHEVVNFGVGRVGLFR